MLSMNVLDPSPRTSLIGAVVKAGGKSDPAILRLRTLSSHSEAQRAYDVIPPSSAIVLIELRIDRDVPSLPYPSIPPPRG